MNVRFFICALVFCLLSSCANFGPRQLPSNRLRYNYSLENSDIQQRLLNIVRLRYSDAPYFLNVSSIVSQFTYTGTMGAGISNNIVTTRAKSPIWQATGGGVLTEAPTITYTPLQGKKYVSLLLTPIDLTVIYMMIREGWAIDRIFRLLVQNFGPLDNRTHAYGTSLTTIPHYDEFREFSNILRMLQYNNLLEIDDETINKKPAIKFTVRNFNTLNAAQRKILARVNLTPSTPTIWLVSFSSKTKQYINLQTSTVLSVFNYLSKAVEVPPEHVTDESAPLVRLKHGQIHDWTSATKGMLRIYSAEHKPKGAAVAIRYRKHWFYIKDNDFDSKQTLDLLTIIVNIYEGSPSSSAPVFTIS